MYIDGGKLRMVITDEVNARANHPPPYKRSDKKCQSGIALKK